MKEKRWRELRPTRICSWETGWTRDALSNPIPSFSAA